MKKWRTASWDTYLLNGMQLCICRGTYADGLHQPTLEKPTARSLRARCVQGILLRNLKSILVSACIRILQWRAR